MACRHAVGETGKNTSTFGLAKPGPKCSLLSSERSRVTTGASPIANGLSAYSEPTVDEFSLPAASIKRAMVDAGSAALLVSEQFRFTKLKSLVYVTA